jgi:hypothetical protein
MAEIEVPNPHEIEEHAADRFTKGVALTTALYAVLLAVTSLGGNNASKEMMMAQQQSSDQWSFYQGKTIREHLYGAQKVLLSTRLAEDLPPAAREKIEQALTQLEQEANRYRDEKKEIETRAKELEAERDHNAAKDPFFDYAEVLLQISIVMASIAILSKARPVFYVSIATAVMGALLCVNGFTLLVHFGR